MEEVILISPNVSTFLKHLVYTLYTKEYFGFEDSAHEYVNKLRIAIYKDLPTITHHETPKELKKYGNFFVKIKGSKRTTWYVFFDKSGHRYLIEFITNNHMPESGHLNKL